MSRSRQSEGGTFQSEYGCIALLVTISADGSGKGLASVCWPEPKRRISWSEVPLEFCLALDSDDCIESSARAERLIEQISIEVRESRSVFFHQRILRSLLR